MKILYLPIIEPGDNHATALKNKRGLLDALTRAGNEVFQLDYLDYPRTDLFQHVLELCRDFQPNLILTQLHGADIFTPEQIREIKKASGAIFCNWSGDSWAHSLTAQPILDMAREFDLQLTAAPDVLPVYKEHNIPAYFWQIAYEAPVGDLPDMPAYDIVFLGNVISDARREMLKWLRTLPYKVGIYGDWEGSDGRCTYDFGAGEALYQKAKIAIADNTYPDQRNYISNRPIQVMMAHGALLLHQHVPNMEVVSCGWKAGVHYIEWRDLVDLEIIIRNLLNYHARFEDNLSLICVDNAYAHASAHHTYDVRVRQLFEMLEAVYT